MGVEADSSRLCLCRGRFVDDEIGYVVAGPLRSVPPHPLLSFAPWLPGWIRRSAVVQESPVGGPREAPVQLRARLTGRIGLFAGRKIPVGSRKHARIDPRRARRRAIVCEDRKTRQMLAWVVAVVAVHFLEELSLVGLSDPPLLRILVLVVEEQVLESLIASGLTLRIELLQALAELIREPHIGAAVARRLSRFEVRLQHPLRVGKGALGFCDLRCRKEEDLGLDVLDLYFAALHFRRGLPEIRGLVLPV